MASFWNKFKNYYPLLKIEWALHQNDFPAGVRRAVNDLIAAVDAELAQEGGKP